MCSYEMTRSVEVKLSKFAYFLSMEANKRATSGQKRQQQQQQKRQSPRLSSTVQSKNVTRVQPDVETHYIQTLEQEVDFLELENSLLKSELEKDAAGCDVKKEKTRKCQVNVKSGEANVEALLDENEQLKKQLAHVTELGQAYKRNLSEEVVELRKKLDDTVPDISCREAELAQLRIEVEEGKQKLAQATRMVAFFKAQCKSDGQNGDMMLCRKHGDKQAQVEKLANELKLLECRMSELNERYQQSQDEKLAMKKQLRQAELQAKKDRLIAEKVIEENENLIQENSQLQVTVSKMLLQTDTNFPIVGDEKCQSELVQMKENERLLRAELISRENALHDAHVEQRRLCCQIEDLESTQRTLKQSQGKLYDQIESLQSASRVLSDENKQLRQEILALETSIETHLANIQQQSEEIKTLRNRLSAYEQQKKIISAKLRNAQQEHREKFLQLNQLATEFRQISQSLYNDTSPARYLAECEDNNSKKGDSADVCNFSKMADPLKFFRDYILNNRRIVERDEYIIFGDTAFNKDAKTNYLVWNKKDEYYTVGSLWFFYKNRELLHTTYVKEAVNLSAPIPQSIPVSRLTSLADAQAEAKRPRVEDEEQARKDKERLMAILDRGTSMNVTKPDTIRDLSKEHGLTAEKIAALRSKALARKRTQIKNTEEEIEEPTRTFVENDKLDANRDIISRERTYRTRTTVMQSSVNLANQVFAILERMKAKENKNRPQPAVVPEAVEKHRAGYSRYAQERFRKEETEDFNIDTKRSFAAQAMKIDEHLEPKKTIPDSAKVISNAIKPPMKRVSRTPIIIIPSANSSLITVFNVRELLENFRFVSSAEKRAAGAKREPEVLIQRSKEGGVTVPYRVVDNPLRFLPEDWDRVVAVFAQGPAWQFKGWPLGASPTDIFSKVKAFHLTWDDDKLDNNISQWAVDVMALSRTKRHLDRAIFQKFWESVERHIRRHKPFLRY
ncbi:Parafibromin [Trichinella papuae]|uniref:Parafibromin n=1 Tax=Trichinella papuae TaxID=268474 RepID=A0A0V1MM64_9BILA|nr:Parafibromin [Trichinella papuae]